MKSRRALGLVVLAAALGASALIPVAASTAADPPSEAAGVPLSISVVQTLKQNDQGGGPVTFTNCPDTCRWLDNYLGYASTQQWGLIQDSPITGAVAGVDPVPAGTSVDLGTPFALSEFGHHNLVYRGDWPTHLAIQTLLTVQPPAGDPAVFSLRGPDSLRLNLLETDNQVACDPDIQVTTTPCDDLWTLPVRTATTTASGVTWHFELLGWGTGDGTFTRSFASEERQVTTRQIYGRLTIDTNTTTSTLTVEGTTSPVLTMTVAPVPQTGGTVSFTDGGDAIAGCTAVPVDAAGQATCTPASPAPGAHSFGGGFGGSFGYAASTATTVPHTVPGADQTIDFTAPTGLTYGDADVQLGATASSALPVTYTSATPSVCTVGAGGLLDIVGAGTCSVTASQAGNSTYDPAEETRTFQVAKAMLTVTADDKTRVTGTPNPPLTTTTTGFVNGDDASVITGSPGLSTTATAASPAGTYPITVSVAGLSATNYGFTGVAGTLTVTTADPFDACAPDAPVPAGYRLITGTAGHNLLVGTSGKDLFRAGAGNDVVTGGGGDDIICGGAGNDGLDGGSGNDLVDGGSGLDFLYGGSGTDTARDPDRLTFRAQFEKLG